MSFIKEAIKNPSTTGALMESSEQLAQLMVECADIKKSDRVIEIGPGEGVITKEILKHTTKLHAIEINPELAKKIEGCKVSVGSAEQLSTYTKPVNKIVSGLPWSIFPEQVQDTILEQIKKSLLPKGTFVTFAYYPLHLLPNAQKFRRKLEQKFFVEKSAVVWGNVPPAFVYICKKK